ncbi:MAG: lectin-like protein [Clostridia bacterium]
MKKRILSVLVVFVMCLVSMPMMIIAENDIVDFDGRRYQRFELSMSWKEAKEYCENMGGHLATIMSEEEQEIVKNLVASGNKAQYWLGATDELDEGTWIWVTGEEMTYFGPTVTFNNYQGNEHYLQMQRHHWGDESKLGVWNDINNENWISGEEEFFSTENVGFICEWGIIASNWAQPELAEAEKLGIIPEILKEADLTKSITREEFAAVSVKVFEALSGTAALPAITNPFVDTNNLDVLKAYNLGVAIGVSSDRFDPDADLNREQCATMLTRVFKRVTIPGWSINNDDISLEFTMPTPFADDDKISDWAKESVYFMNSNGIIKGIGDNKFGPRNITTEDEATGYANATREQALIIAIRMVKNFQ